MSVDGDCRRSVTVQNRRLTLWRLRRQKYAPDAAAIIAEDYVIVLIAKAVIRLCRCEIGIVGDLFENVDVPALGA